MSNKILNSPFFIQYVPVAILNKFSLNYSVSFFNNYKNSYSVFVTLFVNGKAFLDKPLLIGSVEPKKIFIQNEEDLSRFDSGNKFLAQDGSKCIYVHFVPSEYVPFAKSYDSKIEITIPEIQYHVGLSDIFLEYRNRDDIPIMSVGTGGPPAWNLSGKNVAHSTIIQGAKCVLGEKYRSYLLLFNGSIEFSYNTSAKLKAFLFDDNGRCVFSESETVPAFDFRLMELFPKFDHQKGKAFFNILGFTAGTTVFPYVVVENKENGSMFIEHGMPPHTYAHQYSAKNKLEASKYFIGAEFK